LSGNQVGLEQKVIIKQARGKCFAVNMI